MTYGTVTVRATRAAKAAVVILTAVSCSVYDESLLGHGSAGAGNGGTSAGSGHSGTAGDETTLAGRSGSSNGGSSGGDAGMMDTAGAMEAGGDSSEAGNVGTGGAAPTAGGGGRPAGGGTAGGGTGGRGTAGSGTGGSGGTVAGSGGTAGSGGAAGGSTAGSGGTAGSATASGCAKLLVPIDDTNDRAHFVISLASAVDLSNTTYGVVSMHVYVQAGVGGTLFNYVQDASPNFRFFGPSNAQRPLLSSMTGWQTLSFNVGAQDPGSTGIVKSNITRVGIEINANSTPASSTWSNPTIVYVDSITVTTTATATPLSFTLDTSSTVSTTGTSSDVTGQVLWPNNGSSDTTASNVKLTWQATCP